MSARFARRPGGGPRGAGSGPAAAEAPGEAGNLASARPATNAGAGPSAVRAGRAAAILSAFLCRPRPSRPTAEPRAMTLDQDIERILFSEKDIVAGIDRVADEVTRAYRGREFTVVSVLKGSCVFASDLIRRIPIPLELAFVSASSYGAGTSGGDLALNFFPAASELVGRNLLLVDDILDTGRTLSHLTAELGRRGAAEVRTCVFLDKPARRAVDFRPDFRAFEVEDLFVVGYGLDFAGR